MAENSSISWTHHTFNPWIGCTKVSPGCKFCYAEAYAEKYGIAKWGNAPRYLTADSNWAKPLSWNNGAKKSKTRYRVFCASLADIFEDNDQLSEWRENLWILIEKTPNLDWLLLTKRPENYIKFFPKRWASGYFPDNIWIGTTICTQKEYDNNWYWLRMAQRHYGARVSFISFEPLLENISLNSGTADWNIVGGESGFLKYARPLNLGWVKSLMVQITAINTNPLVPRRHLFIKQLGAHLAKKLKMRDKKGEFGIEDLPAAYDWLKVREIPEIEIKNKHEIEIKNKQIDLFSV